MDTKQKAVVNHLQLSKALIANPDNWEHKNASGIGTDKTGNVIRRCAWVAVGSDTASAAGNHAAASQYLFAATQFLFPERARRGNAVIWFNDHPDTTHDDVMAVFDKAIELAKEQKQ